LPAALRRILEDKHRNFTNTYRNGNTTPDNNSANVTREPAATEPIPAQVPKGSSRALLSEDFNYYPSITEIINLLDNDKPRDGYGNFITPITSVLKATTVADLLYYLYETADANIQTGDRQLPRTPFAVLSDDLTSHGSAIAPIMACNIVRACEKAAKSFESDY
jgi:hypothetical protein